ncbi:MAG: SRPBCC family protein [Thermodesulfobacteriota bacterium]
MKITKVVEIETSPEKVFDLISNVEDFSSYSSLIKGVKKLTPNRYRWTAEIAGISFEWDAAITQFERPVNLGWSSVKGLKISGTYNLKAIDGGTRVYFTMEYHLPIHILDRLTEPLIENLLQSVAQEVLTNVKRRLKENGMKNEKP